VSRHHGLPENDEASILLAACAAPGSLRKVWKREAKANHLKARRRTIRLEEIPEAQFPVILEIDGARNFVVLLERESENEYRIQFPDTREAIVTRERIAEVYDGTCVFFSPEKRFQGSSDDDDSSGSSGGGGLRRLLGRKASSSKFALLFNAGLLGAAGLMIAGQKEMFAGLEASSGLTAALTLVAAVMFSVGAILLRKEFLKRDGSAGGVDLLCACLILPLAMILGGSIAIPLLAVGLLVAAYLFVSRRLGSVDSRLATFRRPLLGGAIALGVGGMIFQGSAVEPAGIVAVFGLGVYALYLLMRSDRVCQESRLLALS
jgi:hypothetical protein